MGFLTQTVRGNQRENIKKKRHTFHSRHQMVPLSSKPNEDEDEQGKTIAMDKHTENGTEWMFVSAKVLLMSKWELNKWNHLKIDSIVLYNLHLSLVSLLSHSIESIKAMQTKNKDPNLMRQWKQSLNSTLLHYIVVSLSTTKY